ncbi:hypothetical protein [Streptomyces griseus]|uniref:hypothetical protein n=1 Tax=Streptomyces griseus TaxID=1911 RepID=UPI0015869B02|nr:hypothetical protein [Streptomyces griseus]
MSRAAAPGLILVPLQNRDHTFRSRRAGHCRHGRHCHDCHDCRDCRTDLPTAA